MKMKPMTTKTKTKRTKTKGIVILKEVQTLIDYLESIRKSWLFTTSKTAQLRRKPKERLKEKPKEKPTVHRKNDNDDTGIEADRAHNCKKETRIRSSGN